MLANRVRKTNVTTFRSLVRATATAILLFAVPVSAKAGLDAATLKAYGGTYMADCANPASPKATIFADSLVFLHGSRRVAAGNVEPQFSFFGNSAPENYRVALVGEVPNAGQMFWFVHEDESGYYLMLDGDTKVVAAIGKTLVWKKFRRCDGASARAAPKPPATPKKTYALTDLSASGILLDPKAKAAFYKALGPLRGESWLADLDGPSSENVNVKIAGKEYVRAYCCKNHDCYDYNTVLLYSADQNLVYGKVYQRGKSTLIGAPPPAIAKDLDRLWRELFRSNPQ
jgi:hypothetical protein